MEGWAGIDQEYYTFEGIPTDIISDGQQQYTGPFSYFAYSTEVTGASGVVITSPTPYYGFADLKFGLLDIQSQQDLIKQLPLILMAVQLLQLPQSIQYLDSP